MNKFLARIRLFAKIQVCIFRPLGREGVPTRRRWRGGDRGRRGATRPTLRPLRLIHATQCVDLVREETEPNDFATTLLCMILALVVATAVGAVLLGFY